MPSINFATTALASPSSPAMKIASRSWSRSEGREPVSSVFQPIVLKAFTRRALGVIFATSSLEDRKSTRLNSSHVEISYAVFCLKKKKKKIQDDIRDVDRLPALIQLDKPA